MTARQIVLRWERILWRLNFETRIHHYILLVGAVNFALGMVIQDLGARDFVMRLFPIPFASILLLYSCWLLLAGLKGLLERSVITFLWCLAFGALLTVAGISSLGLLFRTDK